MRWPWVFSLMVALATGAEARPEATRTSVDFWREMIEPHAEEVGAITSKARELLARPDHAMNSDTDWAVETRARFSRDAFNMLRYARRLAPHNAEVLALLGRAADELGLARDAIEALEACARVTTLDKVPLDVAGRLGAIYVRLGDLDTAIRWLRLAQAPLSAVSAPAIVNLANVLAVRGQTAKAIDTLLTAIPASMLGNYSHEMTLAQFALAVLYDRDDQRAAAFTVLDQMQNGLQQQYATYVQNELAKLRLPNAEDLHYYRGLLYESLGQYVEARTEWAHYAASGPSPWRARALEHIVAIDILKRAAPGATQNTNGLAFPPPLPHRSHP